MRMFYNLFCNDIEAQMAFYAELLHLDELPQRRSDIYRALDTGDSELGFNAMQTYGLLSLAEREAAPEPAVPVPGYATFMLDTVDQIDAVANNVTRLGGGVIKAPYKTYYDEWQAVLHDPEHRVFRISCAL